jgi:protein-S-isoprenylcysteine O-methyltransferase Ste14
MARSSAVRVQSDRGHAVCRAWPYSVVRHPGYVSFLSYSLGEALLLPYEPVFIMQAAFAALIVLRTVLVRVLLWVSFFPPTFAFRRTQCCTVSWLGTRTTLRACATNWCRMCGSLE